MFNILQNNFGRGGENNFFRAYNLHKGGESEHQILPLRKFYRCGYSTILPLRKFYRCGYSTIGGRMSAGPVADGKDCQY